MSVSPSYGQGYIFFNNYGATTDAIVFQAGFGPVGSAGFHAGLAYEFGTITDPLANGLNGYLSPLLTLSGIIQLFNPATPGYFQGPIITIPGYTAGPITFQVLAYNGLDYDSPTTTIRGTSALFTLQAIATGTQPVDEFGPGFKPFCVGFCVPEPGTVALVGLGLASLLVLRQKGRSAAKD